MKSSAIEHFLSQHLGLSGEVSLEVFEQNGDHVTEGVIKTGNGQWFPITGGVPCFLTGVLKPDFSEFAARHNLVLSGDGPTRDAAAEQAKTNETFSDKWRRFKNYGLEPAHQEFLYGWYCKKFGMETVDQIKGFYASKGRVLECGPGSGFNTRFIAEHTEGEVFALDVSEAADTTFGNTKHLKNCNVVKADLMLAPFPENHFDFIIADGVLHHTPDTREAVRALYRLVKPGGQFFFYVYRRMGAARAFVDQHIRESFSKMEAEACYEACEGITELGRELSKLNASITLDKPIPVLGIPAGTHNVQRLLYYNFVKCFWNDAFDYETNNMVNFDWYHPHNAWQHSNEEVQGWLDELGVKEASFNDSNPNGISVMLRKPE